MLTVADYNRSFMADQKQNKLPVVIYGAGNAFEMNKEVLPPYDYICDKSKKEIAGEKVISPEQLESLNSEIRILFVVKNKNHKIFDDVCSMLGKMDLNATIYNYFESVDFDLFDTYGHRYIEADKKAIKVNIVCKEDGWILQKMAHRLFEELEKMEEVQVSISKNARADVDINHHVQFGEGEVLPGDTVMISHVDCLYYLDVVRKQLETASLGICMSRETMDKLAVYGIPREKLCYINPGHDGKIAPRKYVVGVTHRNHPDNRKNNQTLVDIFAKLDPTYFKLRIMGDGWDGIVEQLRAMEYEIDYYNAFDYEIYTKDLMPSLDYYLFYGMDEGSMGYMDAAAAGIKTIVTPQGYHLDVGDKIDYPCRTVDEFIKALHSIQKERSERVELLKKYSWKNYADKHLLIWKYLARTASLKECLDMQHCYVDGICSMLLIDKGYTFS